MSLSAGLGASVGFNLPHRSFEGFGAGVESCQKTLPPVVLCHSHNAATGVKSHTLQRPQARPASILTQGRQDYKRRAQLPFSSPAPALVGSVSCFAVSSRAGPSAAYKHLGYRPRRLMSNSTMTTRTTMMRMGIPTVTVIASIEFFSSVPGPLHSRVYGVSPIESPPISPVMSARRRLTIPYRAGEPSVWCPLASSSRRRDV
jgi:hypothetical protein